MEKCSFEQKNVTAGAWFRKCWSDNSDESDDDSDEIFDESSDNNVGHGGTGGRGLSDHLRVAGVRKVARVTPLVPVLRQMHPCPLIHGFKNLKGKDEPNTDVSQPRRGSNIIEQVPHDTSKRTMISLDGGEFTDPKAAYNGALVEKYGSDPANHPIYESMMMTYGWGSWSEMIRKVEFLGSNDAQNLARKILLCILVFACGSYVTGVVCAAVSVNHLDSVRGELKEELKEEMKVELKEEMKNELKEEMCEQLKKEMLEELKEETRAKIQDMLVEYGIKSHVTRQRKTKQDRSHGILGLSQRAYIEKVLKKYNLQNCSPTFAPVVKGDTFGAYQCPKDKLEQEEMRLILMLLYPIPRMKHWKAAKKVLRYLQETRNSMLTYRKTNNLEVIDPLDKGLPSKLFLEHVAGMGLRDSQI
ncbi:hypothetical protein Tco_0155711 [Tanacetum coccineum]